MVRVVWTVSAIGDLAQIRSYLEQFDPATASRIAHRLIEAGDSLASFPKRGRAISDDRRELTSAAPYIIRYAVQGSTVTILRVQHGARAPD